MQGLDAIQIPCKNLTEANEIKKEILENKEFVKIIKKQLDFITKESSIRFSLHNDDIAVVQYAKKLQELIGKIQV